MKYRNLKNKNNNELLLASVQIINLCIGVILTLICTLIYITVEEKELKYTLVVIVITIAIIIFIKLFQKTNKNNGDNVNTISTIALVNENNQIIKEWDIEEQVSLLIGKSTVNSKVDIDLEEYIYSESIEDEHAVMNYAGGKWYIEDLCSTSGVSIQKIEDGMQYKLVKYSPCTISKGDILFIGRIKLLLK